VTAVNLIDKKKDELALGTAFGEIIDGLQSSKPKYVWFDFHHECRNMKWENLSKLIGAVAGDLERYGYFAADKDGRVQSKQNGVMRTNCIDNLDRTNVVQSLFARHILLLQLGKASTNALSSPFKEFEAIFKNVWADNADAMSLLYSGTGALKNEFTRTGKQSLRGNLNDGLNSLIRYYKNNFEDGHLHDALDLFLGNFKPYKDAIRGSPFTAKNRSLQQSLLKFFLTVLLAFLAVFILWSYAAPNSLRLFVGYGTVAKSLVWFFLGCLIAGFLALKNGLQYTNQPRLRVYLESIKDKDV